MSRPAKVHINLTALRHNLTQIRSLAPGCSILAMVKSNAYGHGLERIAAGLSEVDAFGVACSAEGILLRKAGMKNAIVLMEGIFAATELPKVIAQDFTLVVHHQAQIDMLLAS